MRTFTIHQRKAIATVATAAEEINAAQTRAIRKNKLPEFAARLSSVIIDISNGEEPQERIEKLLRDLRNE